MNKVLPILCLALIIGGHQLFSQEVIQLTDNNYIDHHPRISNGNVVWIGGGYRFPWSGNDTTAYESQIYYYHILGLGPSAITDSDIAKYDLEIAGDKLAWSGAIDVNSENTREIYLFDLNAPDSIVQITDNDIADRAPKISENNMVWWSRNADVNVLTQRVYYYNLNEVGQGTPLMLANDGKPYLQPTIHGNHVAWYYADGSDSEVAYYNLETQEPVRQLSSTNVFVYDIQLTDDKLWWNGWHNDIHSFDLETQESPELFYDVDPNGYSISLDATNDYVTWSRYNPNDNTSNVFYADASDPNTLIQLTDDETFDSNPTISGGYIIWERGERNDTELFYFDLINQGPIVQLTDNDFKDGFVVASGNNIAWQGGYVDEEIVDYEVYMDSTFEIFTSSLPQLSTANEELPRLSFQLDPIAPNPVSDQALIEYRLTEGAQVTLQVLDFHGRTIEVLTDDFLAAGRHQATFFAQEWPAGIYFVALTVDNARTTQRLIVTQ